MERSIILYQYLWLIHIVTLTPSGYAQGYAVGRNNDAILRGAVGAEDDGARVVIHTLLLLLSVESERAT